MDTQPAATQSTFVTVLAWILIIFNAFGVFVALIQGVVVQFVFPAMPRAGIADQVIPLGMFQLLVLASLALTAFLVYAAYALLKRRNWARRTFVVGFVLAAVWDVLCVIAVVLGASILGEVPVSAADPAGLATAFRVLFWSAVVLGIAFAVLFAWLAKRLLSPEIRAEFA